MKHDVFLGLGSNVGGRVEFLGAAIRALSDIPMTVVQAVSRVYVTEPVGPVEQNDFLNIAVSINTDQEPLELYEHVKEIETRIGRRESERWGPREIDIDILLIGHQIISGNRLTVPHPQLEQRNFVLYPLADIAAAIIHPVHRKSIAELKEQSNDRHAVTHSESHTSQLLLMINDSITNPTI